MVKRMGSVSGVKKKAKDCDYDTLCELLDDHYDAWINIVVIIT